MNIILLSGTLDGDPKSEGLTSGAPRAVFYLTSTYLTSLHERRTSRHRVVVWGDLATGIMTLKAGDGVLAVGQIQTRYWRDPKGCERLVAEVLVESRNNLVVKVLHTLASPSPERAEGEQKEPSQTCDATNDVPF